MARQRSHDKRVLVIGLGRFGGSLATELVTHGWDVLGMDSMSRRVQAFSEILSHTVIADSTDDEALRQVGAHEFTRAVVAIGSHLEESILTTSLLVDMGVPHIWAKAVNRRHGRILQQIGAHHVVLPEHDMGERVAHLVSGRMLDFIEIEEDFALGKTRAPREIIGKALGESGIRNNYRITVVCIKRHGEQFTYATAETVPQKGDIIMIAGKTKDVEHFAEQD
ncbi:TrkA family potassium uptake protein [Lipingzhangella sp. LS1_29]|uniref:TrkA family potassium uptake protein n=1 Tax=Lipingzhangella rawalii TaxID=2055835 RepID=A0ABU2H9I8_9ACTN|nr:TrkA family potassium uptake protein [Lipingzhangella rawalii]MDS1271977.1 TrkA family potassium uptake protein [Lipingzhangella rawalii]